MLPLPNSLMVMAVQYNPCIFLRKKILVLRRRLDWILDRVLATFLLLLLEFVPQDLRVRSFESSSGVVPPCAGYMDVASGRIHGSPCC